jgi:hypothetical protein
MAHAAAQHLADEAGLAMLHVKGPALDPLLRHPGRTSSDADVLLRPDDAEAFVTLLCRRGWVLQTSFAANSSFEHAAALRHDHWGALDVHRWFPGPTLRPDDLFDHLWVHRSATLVGGRRCAVPSVPAQALLVVLHAARASNPARARLDVAAAFTGQPEAVRAQVRGLVRDWGAEVAFAAATGGLDAHRRHPHYLQWRVASHGGTRLEEWRGRLRAAPSRRHAARVALRAPLVNTQHLAVVLGRAPTRAEIAHEFTRRAQRALAQEWRARWTT